MRQIVPQQHVFQIGQSSGTTGVEQPQVIVQQSSTSSIPERRPGQPTFITREVPPVQQAEQHDPQPKIQAPRGLTAADVTRHYAKSMTLSPEIRQALTLHEFLDAKKPKGRGRIEHTTPRPQPPPLQVNRDLQQAVSKITLPHFDGTGQVLD